MKPVHYDIVRRENENNLRWLESANNLDAAKSRIQELISFWPGEFQVLEQDTHQIVAAIDMSRSRTSQVPREGPGPEISMAMQETN